LPAENISRLFFSWGETWEKPSEDIISHLFLMNMKGLKRLSEEKHKDQRIDRDRSLLTTERNAVGERSYQRFSIPTVLLKLP
jgi:hypothetical protein